MSDAIGNIPWWGFSPAEDLLKVIENSSKVNNKELHFLVIGSGDGRHILKTVSQIKDKSLHLNFYIVENNLELIARQMLFLNLAVDKSHGLQEKVFLYLDLFGNTLMRKVTEEYLHSAANEMIQSITSPTQNGIFDFSLLKFKERDALEGIFKFWRTKENLLDLSKCWEYRLRQHLGVRYDSRENVFDWDYSMRLKDVASVVNWQEYKRWRETGVAFNFCSDSTCLNTNKTLASGLVFKKDGERICKRGYWGDIVVSPYISFGIECDESNLMAKNNNQHISSSLDISKYNVTALFHELCTGEKFVGKFVEKEQLVQPFSSFQLHFLSLDVLPTLHKKSKYRKKFDLIYFANSVTNFLDQTISELFSAPRCLLIVELTKFLLELKEEHHVKFNEKLCVLASKACCEPLKEFAAKDNSHAYFSFVGFS